MENIQLYSEKVIIEADTANQSLVTLMNVDIGEIVSQLNIEDLLGAITAADLFSEMQAYVLKEMKGEDE